MNIAEQNALRAKASATMVEWATTREPPFTGQTGDDFREAITAAHLIADETRLDLQRWVDAARRSGTSWSEVGDALGISKQAAQQRFKSDVLDENSSEDEGLLVVRQGATAFNEMAILREEGKKGNELVDVGMAVLKFRPTGRQWEYRRAISGFGGSEESGQEGWVHVANWLPFRYYKRVI